MGRPSDLSKSTTSEFETSYAPRALAPRCYWPAEKADLLWEWDWCDTRWSRARSVKMKVQHYLSCLEPFPWSSTGSRSLDSSVHIDSGQTRKPTSHPVASALKMCISSNRLRIEVRKKASLEIHWQNKVRGDKVRGKKKGMFPHWYTPLKASLSTQGYIFRRFFYSFFNFPVICRQQVWSYCARALRLTVADCSCIFFCT